MDFLEKPLAWFSKFYLRVQSEICGSNNLLICSFQKFFKFSAKYFQTFGQKTSRNCQNYLPRAQMNKFWLEKFFKNFEPFWIFWRTWAWFSNFIFVSRVKNPEESFFILLFRIFSDFERKSFQTFGQKTSRNCKNPPSAWADEQFLALKNFQKFSSALDFLQKPLAWCSNFYLRVHIKNSGRNDFFNLLFIIFSDFERIFFRLSAKKLQVFKLTFYVSRGTRCGLNFFKKNWIVLDFLQKPLAWFSKFYPCVQSKNCGRNVCFVWLFRTFSEFERNVFRLLAKKLQEVVETTFYVCRGTVCGLKFFLYFKSFWIFWRNLWHGSQNSIYVSRVKFAEATIFWSVLFRIFLNFQRNIFRLLARKLQEVVKTTFRVCRWTSFGLKSFLKILNRFGFSEELGHGSQTLSSCPE